MSLKNVEREIERRERFSISDGFFYTRTLPGGEEDEVENRGEREREEHIHTDIYRERLVVPTSGGRPTRSIFSLSEERKNLKSQKQDTYISLFLKKFWENELRYLFSS